MRILLVEDDPTQSLVLSEYLKAQGHEVDTASNRDRADEYMQTRQYDVAAVDLVLTVSTGDTVAERAYHRGLGVVIMSATTEEQLQVVKETLELRGARVHHVLKKPFTPRMLLIAIEDAYRQKGESPPSLVT